MTRFVTSDADGRYDLLVNEIVKVEPSPETGYLAPCPAGTGSANWSGGANNFYMPDVHVVHETVLSTTGTPDMMRSLGLALAGRIVGSAPSHSPIAGARVELDNSGFVFSNTLSDAAGRYLLCTWTPGSGSDQTIIVRARKQGYRDGSVEVFLSGVLANEQQIELTPQ